MAELSECWEYVQYSFCWLLFIKEKEDIAIHNSTLLQRYRTHLFGVSQITIHSCKSALFHWQNKIISLYILFEITIFLEGYILAHILILLNS